MEVLHMKKGIVEDLVLIGGLVLGQFAYAGNSVLLSHLMSLGLGPLTIVIFSTFATFVVISPFAVYFERKQWTRKLSLKLVAKLVLISFAGVTLFQSFYLEGIKLTSPAVATAMPNLAPGFIFVIACVVRLEKVKLSCVYSKVKIIGTLVCVVGAFAMSVMHNRSVKEGDDPSFFDLVFDKDKIIGCFYLLVAVFVLSSNVVLQASTLGEFPAPISLCAATSLIGVFMTAAIQLLRHHKLDLNRPRVSIGDLLGYSLLGGTVSGACVSFTGWAMKKRGPVLVSMFSPIGTVISVILSVFTLGETINLGSLGGMLLMFTGLYFVLWAKGKEGYPEVDSFETEFDAEKPLLG